MSEESVKSGRLRWDDLAAFLAVARAGGLAAAAKDVASSAPTLGRRMRALERALGRELFVRRTHGYDLTDAGIALKREIEDVADRIDRAAAIPETGGQPLVTISAGTWTSLALARRWRDIAGDPPDVRLRFVSSEDVLSITRREVSVAIRNKRPTEPGLAGRRLGRNDFAVYGLEGAARAWIVHSVDTPSSRWAKARAGKNSCTEVSHPRLALDLALAGAGQLVLPTFLGDKESKLERRSDPIVELSHDAWLVAHDDDRHLPEIRRVIDRLYLFRP
ncbi:LysR family transcriptional regulator [Hoeflea sp.]|uniref:LysR family transcriptional regulator n=1 Tax=Hoeflea sp. TaxID=1940281 RepID=UPI003B02587A